MFFVHVLHVYPRMYMYVHVYCTCAYTDSVCLISTNYHVSSFGSFCSPTPSHPHPPTPSHSTLAHRSYGHSLMSTWPMSTVTLPYTMQPSGTTSVFVRCVCVCVLCLWSSLWQFTYRIDHCVAGCMTRYLPREKLSPAESEEVRGRSPRYFRGFQGR